MFKYLQNIQTFIFPRFKYWALCIAVCFSLQLTAQHTVKILFSIFPGIHNNDTFFLAGNFNGWNPKDYSCRFAKNEEGYYLELKNMQDKLYEFKCTRGSWEKVETDEKGNGITNRKLQLTSDTVLRIAVAGWEDDFEKKEKKNTASKQVFLMDIAFRIPQLNRTRKIWMYLPDGYAGSKKKYPVLYMQDGQALFDERAAFNGEWGVDECLDSLISKGKQACIVVGIENGPQRINEYNPYYHKRFGEGEGEKYAEFIVKNLKPFIDKNYRTLPSKENTIIAGSSMGGLISLYVFLKYPAVFGKAGIFSPAFWTAPGIEALADSASGNISGKLFFYIGDQEGTQHVKDMIRIQEKIGKNSSSMIYSVVDSEGKHNEVAWHKWFEEFYTWTMATGLNIVTNSED